MIETLLFCRISSISITTISHTPTPVVFDFFHAVQVSTNGTLIAKRINLQMQIPLFGVLEKKKWFVGVEVEVHPLLKKILDPSL